MIADLSVALSAYLPACASALRGWQLVPMAGVGFAHLGALSTWATGCLFPLCSMTVARNVTLATPITVDLLQLGNSYITRQLKKV